MIRKALIGTALAMVVSGAAFADTPIGPGVTGLGGTGLNEADLQLHEGAGPDSHLLLRLDGMPADRADLNILASAGISDLIYAAPQNLDPAIAVGMSSSSAATGEVGGSVLLPGDVLD